MRASGLSPSSVYTFSLQSSLVIVGDWQRDVSGLNGAPVVSQALFIELACEVDELPVVDNFTGQLVMCNFNIDLLYLFESLKTPEAWASNCNQNIRYYPLFGFLEVITYIFNMETVISERAVIFTDLR